MLLACSPAWFIARSQECKRRDLKDTPENLQRMLYPVRSHSQPMSLLTSLLSLRPQLLCSLCAVRATACKSFAVGCCACLPVVVRHDIFHDNSRLLIAFDGCDCRPCSTCVSRCSPPRTWPTWSPRRAFWTRSVLVLPRQLQVSSRTRLVVAGETHELTLVFALLVLFLRSTPWWSCSPSFRAHRCDLCLVRVFSSSRSSLSRRVLVHARRKRSRSRGSVPLTARPAARLVRTLAALTPAILTRSVCFCQATSSGTRATATRSPFARFVLRFTPAPPGRLIIVAWRSIC